MWGLRTAQGDIGDRRARAGDSLPAECAGLLREGGRRPARTPRATYRPLLRTRPPRSHAGTARAAPVIGHGLRVLLALPDRDANLPGARGGARFCDPPTSARRADSCYARNAPVASCGQPEADTARARRRLESMRALLTAAPDQSVCPRSPRASNPDWTRGDSCALILVGE